MANQTQRRSERKNAGQTGTATATAVQRPAMGLKADAPVRNYGSQNAFWYLNREGDLAVVTDKAQNSAIGIENIELFGVTSAQAAHGQLCRVRLTTPAAIIDGITIYASDRVPGDIYLRESSRKVESQQEGQRPSYYRDTRLTTVAKAQVLSYVRNFVTVEEEASVTE